MPYSSKNRQKWRNLAKIIFLFILRTFRHFCTWRRVLKLYCTNMIIFSSIQYYQSFQFLRCYDLADLHFKKTLSKNTPKTMLAFRFWPKIMNLSINDQNFRHFVRIKWLKHSFQCLIFNFLKVSYTKLIFQRSSDMLNCTVALTSDLGGISESSHWTKS